MKKLIFLLLFVPSFLFSQTEFTGLSAGKCNIQQTGSGSGYWQVGITQFNNPRGMDATYIAEGDVLYFNDSGVSFALPVDTVLSAVGNSASVRVLNSGITTISSVPTTAAGIAMGTSNYKIPPFFANMTDNNNQMVVEWAMYVIDSLIANSAVPTIYTASDSIDDATRLVKIAPTQSLYIGNITDGNPYGSGLRYGIFFDPNGNGIGMRSTGSTMYSFRETYGDDLSDYLKNRFGQNKSVRTYRGIANGIGYIENSVAMTTSGSKYHNSGVFSILDTLATKGYSVLGMSRTGASATYSFYAGMGKADAQRPGSGNPWKLSTSDTTFSYSIGRSINSGVNKDFMWIDIPLWDTTLNSIRLYEKYQLPNAQPSATNLAKSIMTWTGNGSTTTPAFEDISSAVSTIYTANDSIVGDRYARMDSAGNKYLAIGQFVDPGDIDYGGSSTDYGLLLEPFSDGAALVCGTTFFNLYRNSGSYFQIGGTNTNHQLWYTQDNSNYNFYRNRFFLQIAGGSTLFDFDATNGIEFYDKYKFPDATPSVTNSAKSEFLYTGTGSATTPSFVRKDYGNESDTTDGSGDITVTCVMPDASYVAVVTTTGTTFAHPQVHTKGASSFKIRFYDAAGNAITATAVTVDWYLVDN